MIDYQDARYIVTEINRLPYYRRCIAEYKEKIDDLERQKSELTMPSSPNGKEAIGDAKGNEVFDYTKVLIDIIAKQDEVKQEMYEYIWLLRKAERYYEQLTGSLESDFVVEYFQTKDKRELQRKFHIGNAYDRMIRITRSVIVKK